MANEERRAGLSRRDIGGVLLGVVGVSALSACTNESAFAEEPTDELDYSEALTSDTDTYVTLRALAAPPTDPAVVVRGRTAINDGGQGVFIWDPNNTSNDNNGTIIKPNSVGAGSPGRWLRLYSGAANVLWWGADPTGTSDSSAAFYAAFTGTHFGQEILVPNGTYKLQPDHPTLRFWERRWTGESASSYTNRHTTIIPTGPGTYLAQLSGAGHVRNLTFDAQDLCDYAFYCSAAHGSVVENVTCLNAKEAGALLYNSTMTVKKLDGSHSKVGLILRGCNGSQFEWLSATYNDYEGLIVQGNWSYTTSQAGSCSILGGVLDLNCQEDTSASQLLLDGAEQVRIHSMYIEGEGAGLRAINKSHECVLIGLRFVGGVPYIAMDLIEARGFSIIGCGAPTGDYGTIRLTTKSDGTGSYYNSVMGNHRVSHVDASSLRMLFIDESGTLADYTCTQLPDDSLIASGPPSCGWWRVGDRIRQSAPVDYAEWTCVAGGYPGTWKESCSIAP